MQNSDIANAVFGFGAYLDLLLSSGYDPQRLDFLMQSYLNIQASLAGRVPPCLAELQSQTVAETPDLQQARRQVLPRWLPDGEKLRIYRLGLLGSDLSSGARPAQCKSD